eukprot:evm.model.NODE_24061_length_13748_cov_26.966177.5
MLLVVLLLLLQLECTTAFSVAGPGMCVREGMRNPRSPIMMAAQSNDKGLSRERHLRLSSTTAAGLLAAATGLTFAPRATHARTQPLGVIDELLAECPTEKSCASSQDDRPPVFQEPWQYDDSTQEKAMRRLKGYVESMPGVEVITAEEGYLRADLMEGGKVNEIEFYFTPNDSIIQFRAARRGEGDDKGANQKRMEKMRIALGFEKIPVLRNRRRALFFLESPLDGWGPSYRDDAPSPEELQSQQAYKDNDPKSPEWGKSSPYPSFLQGGTFLRQDGRAINSN